MKNQPSYYAVIPSRVRYAGIMANAKLLYGEITALANEKGYCWASNSYFAELYGVSEKQISVWFKQLADHNFIDIEITRNQTGTSRKVYLLEENLIKKLWKTNSAHYQKVKGGPPKGNVRNGVGTLPKGYVNNNTSINNTVNTVIRSSETEKETENHRGQYSPAKEKIREMLKKRQIARL